MPIISLNNVHEMFLRIKKNLNFQENLELMRLLITLIETQHRDIIAYQLYKEEDTPKSKENIK